VNLLAVLLLITTRADAGALQIVPTASVLGREPIGFRPGVRLGYEPGPALSVDLSGSMGKGTEYDAGAAIEGRHFFGGDPGRGVFVGARLGAGIAGDPDSVGPWMGLSGVFGVRPASWLQIGAGVGPDIALDPSEGNPIAWRSDLSIGFVLDPSFFQGSGQTRRHRPRRP
jgi:hypothetical protein